MRRVGLVLCLIAIAGSSGCALYSDQESLQKKVTELEDRVKKLEAEKQAAAQEDTNRRQMLERCVTVDAENAYWDYIELNGTKNANGTYTGKRLPLERSEARKNGQDRGV
jgi:hypothetical protein